MFEGFCSVYHYLLTCFPPNCFGKPYRVVEQLLTVDVLFASKPKSRLMACSYYLFTEVSQDLVLVRPER